MFFFLDIFTPLTITRYLCSIRAQNVLRQHASGSTKTKEKDATKVHFIQSYYSEDITGRDILDTGVYAFLPQVERANGPSVSRAQADRAALAHSHGRGCGAIILLRMRR